MDNLKHKLIKEAEQSRKKLIFPLSLFYTPDYETSADKFKEVSLLCTDKMERLKYLNESVSTYLMNPVQYNRYNAYLLYNDIADIYKDTDMKKAIQYYLKSGDMALSCQKDNLAANVFEKAAEMCEIMSEKIRILKKIVECYQGSSWKHHRLNINKQLASLYFKSGEYKEAGDIYSTMSGIYILCACISYHMAGIDSDLEVDDQFKNIQVCIGQDNMKNAIEKYLESNAVETDVRYILKEVIERMLPENDIL